jgi:hypothetical protein
VAQVSASKSISSHVASMNPPLRTPVRSASERPDAAWASLRPNTTPRATGEARSGQHPIARLEPGDGLSSALARPGSTPRSPCAEHAGRPIGRLPARALPPPALLRPDVIAQGGQPIRSDLLEHQLAEGLLQHPLVGRSTHRERAVGELLAVALQIALELEVALDRCEPCRLIPTQLSMESRSS